MLAIVVFSKVLLSGVRKSHSKNAKRVRCTDSQTQAHSKVPRPALLTASAHPLLYKHPLGHVQSWFHPGRGAKRLHRQSVTHSLRERGRERERQGERESERETWRNSERERLYITHTGSWDLAELWKGISTHSSHQGPSLCFDE